MVKRRISFRSYGISSAYHHHPPSLLHSSLAGSRKRKGLNEQAFPMHCSAKNFLTIRHVLTHCGRVTQICVFNTVKLGTSASSP